MTTHSLFPLYSTFFSGWAWRWCCPVWTREAISSPIPGFCFPAQIAHGAVLDLVKKDVDLIFLPHVVRMPHPNRAEILTSVRSRRPAPISWPRPFPIVASSRRCWISQRLRKLFRPGRHGGGELGVGREWLTARGRRLCKRRRSIERTLRELGQKALDEAIAAGKPAILLAGHSYNAFTPEASQSVGKKLSSMGVSVIPADCLVPAGEGPTSWHFANRS